MYGKTLCVFARKQSLPPILPLVHIFSLPPPVWMYSPIQFFSAVPVFPSPNSCAQVHARVDLFFRDYGWKILNKPRLIMQISEKH